MKKHYLFFFFLLGLSRSLFSQVLQANMPSVNNEVATIVRYENTIFIGGVFDSTGSQKREHLAAIDALTGMVKPWSPDPNGQVNKIILAGTKLVVGGTFTSISGQSRGGIAVYDLNTLSLVNTSIIHDYDNYGHALCLHNNYVYFGDNNASLRRFDLNTGQSDPVWEIPNIFPVLSSVTVLGNYVYIGGDYSLYNPHITDFSRFNLSDGSRDTSFNCGVTNGDWVEEVLAYNGKIYVTGSFLQLGGVNQNGMAEVDTSGFVTTKNFYCSNHQNYALFPQGNTLWVGGNSYSIGAGSSYRISQVNINTGFATCWTTGVMSPNGYVISIWVTHDTVYASGALFSTNNANAFRAFNGNPSYINLGKDTLICPVIPFTIQGNPPFASYLWNNGSTNSSLTVTTGGNYWVTSTSATGCKATDSIVVQFCVSAAQIEKDNIGFIVYPNPAKEEVVLELTDPAFKPIEIQILSAEGKTCLKEIVEERQSYVKINLNSFSQGIYILKVNNGVSTYFKKLIVTP